MEVKLIKGKHHTDQRGTLTFNNDFKMSDIKRMYTIENETVEFVRAWQGHKTEQRWFSAVAGSFKIKTVEIDNWSAPNKNLKQEEFILNSESLDVLHVPAGFMTSIQALEENSKIVSFANYELNEINDDHRFPSDYFSA